MEHGTFVIDSRLLNLTKSNVSGINSFSLYMNSASTDVYMW